MKAYLHSIKFMRVFIITVISIFFLSISACQKQPILDSTQIKEGYLDLSDVDFNKQDFVELNGEWEFYWNRLLTSNSDSINQIPYDTLVNCPSVWKNYTLNGKKLPSFGYATFRTKIKLKPDGRRIAIRTSRQGYAYKLFINGKLVIETGKVGENKKKMEAKMLSGIACFFANKSENEIVLQVSNFHLPRAGFRGKIILGNPQKVTTLHSNRLIADGLISGLCFVMFLYSLGMYWYRQKDKATLYFAFISLIMLVRTITHDEYIINYFFPTIPWEIMIRLHYLQLPLSTIPMLLFLQEMFSPVVNKKMIRILVGVAILLGLIILFNQVSFVSKYLLFIELFLVPTLLLMVYIPFRGIKNKIQGSQIILLGTILAVIAGLSDMFNSLMSIPTVYKLQISFAFLILTQALALSQRIFNTEKEKKRIELQNAIIAQKNEELSQMNDEVQTNSEQLKQNLEKINELTNFRDEMMQMIVHDLKNPLTTIINLPERFSAKKKNQIQKYSAQKMLNLVLNILDVRKYSETKIEIDLQEFFLNESWNKIEDQFSFLINQKNISIENNLNKRLKLNADKNLTERILANILSNSLKFTPNNGKIIVMSVETDNQFVKVSVVDSGIGIETNKVNAIFEKYEQASNKQIKYSHGLGLTFCKIAVEAHKGTIQIESETGKGTTLWFTLPKAELSESYYPEPKKKQDVYLSDAEKNFLIQYLPALSELDLSQLSAFRKIIKKIESNATINERWMSELYNALLNSNREYYDQLLKKIID